MIATLELLLIGLYFITQLSPLSLDLSDHCLNTLLRHLLSSSSGQAFLQFLIVDIERTQRFLLFVVGHLLEVIIEVIIVVL